MNIQGFEITPQHGKAGTHNISISPTYTNESLDKEIVIDAVCGTSIAKLTIFHEGRREIFNEDFILVDGGTFNVIKDGL